MLGLRIRPNSVAAVALVPALDAIRNKYQVVESFPDPIMVEVDAAITAWRNWLSAQNLSPLPPQPTAGSLCDPAVPLSAITEGTPSGSPQNHLDAAPEFDARAIPLVTIDPEGSRDLDQAVCIEAAPEGSEAAFFVAYAIASLATFVTPGSQLDQRVQSRGLSLYLPDQSAPLHPVQLSHGGGLATARSAGSGGTVAHSSRCARPAPTRNRSARSRQIPRKILLPANAGAGGRPRRQCTRR